MTDIASPDEASIRDGDEAVSELLTQVGVRVRKAREIKGIPRRVLSEMSGVSPRYLAQLEAGEGNISIGLLKRVALALDHKIEWLVSEDGQLASEAQRVAELFRSADRATQEATLRALSPATSRNARAHRVCLLGLRGAGKSTLGRLTSEALGVEFLELNREIELYAGMPIGDIIALYGQEGYRKLETQALDKVVDKHNRVILAVAGGIVSEAGTYHNLLSRFHTIWLKAAPREHMERVRAQGDERPMEGNPEAMSQLKAILNSREALYERASAHLDTTGQTRDITLRHLITMINDNRFLG